MALITCKDVSLSYENNVVLSGLSFKVNEGDYICVTGENGSGKSTLIKALLSLKSATSGQIKIDSELVRNGIGYLPQQADIRKDFPANVWEVVLSGCLNNRAEHKPGIKDESKPKWGFFRSAGDKEKALANMEKLGIKHLKHKSYRDLSGGQKQRVLLARALCAAKKLIILDEPATGLDPLATEDMYKILGQINNEGMTVIMVSHDIENAVKYAKYILHLNNKQLFFGTCNDYIKSDAGKGFLQEQPKVNNREPFC